MRTSVDRSRVLASVAIAALACIAMRNAEAEWTIAGDVEQFEWRESGTPELHERGPRLGLGASWMQDRDAGWLFGWRGRIYGGTVDYHGSLLFTGEPVNDNSDYSGISNELRAVYRSASLDYVIGGGWDYWVRSLSASQKEYYSLLYLRAGLDFAALASGWHGGGGVKYPFYVREDANLVDIGFDQNPTLTPKGEPSLYGELGYRFANRWAVSLYYDSYRLRASDPVEVSAGGRAFSLFQPESRLETLGVRLERRF